MLAIDLHSISLQRDDRWILRDISFRVPAGACAAILGPNGSGKSTLARILATHLWPTTGHVSVLGQHFGETDLHALRKEIRLLQPAGPYDVANSLTTRQVVLTGFFGTLWLYDTPTPDMLADSDRLLSQVGLLPVADHSYATLSSGERVRALIARALVHRPRLLLLDEPTAGLDLLAREQILATIQSLLESSSNPPTVVLITHHVEELPPATSQVLCLNAGHPIAHGPPDTVLTSDTLSRVYNCPVQVRRSHGRHYAEVHPTAWRDLIQASR